MNKRDKFVLWEEYEAARRAFVRIKNSGAWSVYDDASQRLGAARLACADLSREEWATAWELRAKRDDLAVVTREYSAAIEAMDAASEKSIAAWTAFNEADEAWNNA